MAECQESWESITTPRPSLTSRRLMAWENLMRDLHPESGEELKFVILATDGCESLSFGFCSGTVDVSMGPYDI
jgi:hypothetical protein